MIPLHHNSSRLIFREYRKEDLDLFYEVYSNEQVMHHALTDRCTCKEEVLPLFHAALSHNCAEEKERTAYEFAVYTRDTGEYIGYADIVITQRRPEGGCAEIGYYLLPRGWGHGYATEIGRALCKICFEELGLHRVFACCNAANLASEKVMQKTGMHREGCHRLARFKHGRWMDELVYSLLREEWCPSI